MTYYEPMPIVNAKKFYLRTIKRSDYKDLFDYGHDEENTKFLSWGPMKAESEAKWVIDKIYLPRAQKGLPIGYAIVWRDNNKMIGTIDFHTIDFSNMCGEIGYVLNKNYQGMGIMTEALKLMIQVGFEILNLNRIEIKHVIENEASKRVIEKCDFHFEGVLRKKKYMEKFQKYTDVCIYSILRKEYQRGELKWQLQK